MSNCCPDNINPIPDTLPPDVDPCDPWTPACPDPNPDPDPDPDKEYIKDWHTGDIMVTLNKIEQGISNNIDVLVPAGKQYWFKFKLKEPANQEIYTNNTVVQFPVSGNGGVFFGTIRYQQNKVDCGLSGPGTQLAQSASTVAGTGKCLLVRNEWAYFVVKSKSSVNTGIRLSYKVDGFSKIASHGVVQSVTSDDSTVTADSTDITSDQ